MNKIVIGNLKMNLLSVPERQKYLEWIKKEWGKRKIKKTEVVLCPPSIHLENFQKELPKKISLGAQNCFWEEKGSFTGEISPLMLKNLGASYVILGHSERRRFFAEHDDEIGLKVASVLRVGLEAIVCVGESQEERNEGSFAQVIERQIKTSLENIKKSFLEKVIIAYEPIWSVGTDKIPTSNEIMEAKVLIRKILVENFGKKQGEKPRIIYGGSVSSKTVKETCLESEMDGALIGRESLTPSEFMRIVEIIDSPC